MIKKLKQILQPNPSVPYIRAGKEKEFAGIHKVLKFKSPAYTSNGQNDDEVYNASKVKVSPRPRGSKSPESSPKDSYGEGRIALKVSPDNSEDEYGGHDEEAEIREMYTRKQHDSVADNFAQIKDPKDRKERAREYGSSVQMYPNFDWERFKKRANVEEETELDEKSTHGATHQLRIARKTLLMPDAMVGVMGGMNKKEAAEIIKRSRQRLKNNEPTVMTHENHIHMTVTHESNTKPLFKAKAGSDAEVRTKLESLKANSKGYGYRVGVQNTKTGETWSGKPHHKFPGFGEEAIKKEDLFIEQIPSIPPDQPIGLKPLKKASSIEGLARRGVKLRVAQKKHELLKKRII
jgi:hypothetical protein